MKVNIMKDLDQYNIPMDLISEELEKRGHEVVVTKERFKPDLTCDCSLTNMNMPFTKGSHPRFFLEHGCSITKRQLYDLPIDVFIAFSQHWADYVQKEMDEVYAHNFKIRVGGYPRMDYLLRLNEIKTKLYAEVVGEFHLDSSKLIAVYFPTYRRFPPWLHGKEFRAYKARSVYMKDIYLECNERFNIIICPHILENWEDWEKELPSSCVIRPDQNTRKAIALVVADVIISDTSGIVYEACALQKPIVLIDNPKFPEYFLAEMSAGTKEYMSPVGEVARAGMAVDDLVNYSYKNSAKYFTSRRYWAEKAIGDLSGNATNIVVDIIEEETIGNKS